MDKYSEKKYIKFPVKGKGLLGDLVEMIPFIKKKRTYKRIYNTLIDLYEEVSALDLGTLKQNKTVLLLNKTRNYLEIYKTEVPELLKEKEFPFDCGALEKRLKIAEESINYKGKSK